MIERFSLADRKGWTVPTHLSVLKQEARGQVPKPKTSPKPNLYLSHFNPKPNLSPKPNLYLFHFNHNLNSNLHAPW